MIINLICIGSKPKASEKESIEYYTKQLPKNFNVNFTYLKNLSSSKLSTKEMFGLGVFVYGVYELTSHAIFKLRDNQIYQMKTPYNGI